MAANGWQTRGLVIGALTVAALGLGAAAGASDTGASSGTAAGGATSRDAAPVLGVRPLDREAEALLLEAGRLSPTVQRQLAVVGRSDLVVYLAVRPMRGFETSGMRFVACTQRARLLKVDIDRRKRQDEAIVTLGHELQHVLEVSEAAEVRNAASFDGLYRRVGTQATPWSFETQAAIDAGGQVAAEVRRARGRLGSAPLP